MKLAKYKGYESNSNTIIDGWASKEPFIYVEEVPSDYVDVHTLSDVYQQGDNVFNFNQKRTILSGLFYAKAGNSLEEYASLNDQEKYIGAKLFFTPYNLRVSSIFTDAQDVLNWDELVVKTQGTPVAQYEGRAFVAEKMRQHVGRNYLRKDLMTYAKSKEFGEDCHVFIETYVKYSSYSFINWLTNASGTAYENSGFAQETYLSTPEAMTQLKEELLTILNFG